MTELEIVDSVQHTGEQAVDTVVGGGALAFDVVRKPRTTARRAQKRGAEVTAEIAKDVNKAVDTTLALPERLLVRSLRVVKKEAARKDVVGVVSRAVLGAVHAPAANAAGFFSRVEKETELPKRARRAAATTTRKSAARATVRNAGAATRRTAARTTGPRTTGRSTARSTTSRSTAGRGRGTRRSA